MLYLFDRKISMSAVLEMRPRICAGGVLVQFSNSFLGYLERTCLSPILPIQCTGLVGNQANDWPCLQWISILVEAATT